MTKPIDCLTAAQLRRRYAYDSKTGRLHFVNGPRAGKVVGQKDRLGYLRIWIDGRFHSAARSIWLFVYGEYPDGEIDHINRKKDDNRIENLRCVTRSVNVTNRDAWASSGRKGVYAEGKKWRAQKRMGGKLISLGTFDTIEKAASAYEAAK